MVRQGGGEVKPSAQDRKRLDCDVLATRPVVACTNKGGRRGEVAVRGRVSIRTKGKGNLLEEICMHAAARVIMQSKRRILVFSMVWCCRKDAVQDDHKTPKTIPQHHDYKQLGLDDESAWLLALELGHDPARRGGQVKTTKRGVVGRLAAMRVGPTQPRALHGNEDGHHHLHHLLCDGDDYYSGQQGSRARQASKTKQANVGWWGGLAARRKRLGPTQLLSTATTTATTITTSRSATKSYNMRRGWQQQAVVDGLAARRRQAANHPQPELSYSRGKSMRGGVRGRD